MRQNNDIKSKVKGLIERRSLIEAGEKVLVAVSGGADSVALAHILAAISKEGRFEIEIAYVNHKQRAQAEEEAKLVREFARNLEVRFHAEEISIETEGKALSEDSLRTERYKILNDIAGRIGAAKLAVGHHKNDLAETLLMRLIRGSGPGGLAGLPPQRERIIRPLLEITRREIEEYVALNSLPYSTDETNLGDKYFRTRVRNYILPLIYKENPAFVEAAARLIELLQEDDALLKKCALNRLENLHKQTASKMLGEVELPRAEFNALPRPIKSRILRALLEKEGYPPDYETVCEMISLAEGEMQEWEVSAGNGFYVRAFRNGINIYARKPEPPVLAPLLITGKGVYHGEELKVSVTSAMPSCQVFSNACILDAETVHFPLTVRGAIEGDRLPEKAIAKRNHAIFRRLQKLGCPKFLRNAYPVIADAKNRVVAVPLIFRGLRKKDPPPQSPIIIEIRCPTLEYILKDPALNPSLLD